MEGARGAQETQETLVSITVAPDEPQDVALEPGQAATVCNIALAQSNPYKGTHCLILESDWDEESQGFQNRTTIARLRFGGTESIATNILLTDLCGPVRFSLAGILGEIEKLGEIDIILSYAGDMDKLAEWNSSSESEQHEFLDEEEEDDDEVIGNIHSDSSIDEDDDEEDSSESPHVIVYSKKVARPNKKKSPAKKITDNDNIKDKKYARKNSSIKYKKAPRRAKKTIRHKKV